MQINCFKWISLIFTIHFHQYLIFLTTLNLSKNFRFTLKLPHTYICNGYQPKAAYKINISIIYFYYLFTFCWLNLICHSFRKVFCEFINVPSYSTIYICDKCEKQQIIRKIWKIRFSMFFCIKKKYPCWLSKKKEEKKMKRETRHNMNLPKLWANSSCAYTYKILHRMPFLLFAPQLLWRKYIFFLYCDTRVGHLWMWSKKKFFF